MRAGLFIALLVVVLSLSGTKAQSGDAQLLAAINKAIEGIVNNPAQYATILTPSGGQASSRQVCPFDAMAWPCNPVGSLAKTLSSGYLQLCIAPDAGAPAYTAAGNGWEQIMGGLVAAQIGAHYGVAVTANWTLVDISSNGFFPSLMAALQSGVCDAVFSDVTILYSRSLLVDYTCSYAGDYSGYVVLSANNATFPTIQSFNNAKYTVAIESGTSQVQEVADNAPEADVVLVTGDSAGFAMLQAKTADAYVGDYPSLLADLAAGECPGCSVFYYGNPAPSAAFVRMPSSDVQPSCPSPPSCPDCVCNCPSVNCCGSDSGSQGSQNSLNFLFADMIPAQ